ncbi:RluA family pseudouridine synthase [Ideonella oryzae]|uniref:Pseudouridine synthase n=1 Tax=Ideonella oryzae TaxID=2937441 RepID=A0ABT1BJY5_9BURK|nr:RluA family pseudouridine synthase [Ideonella oryzae]MCO5976520.1 RluA family pseudouridine synthase [Ideonella oryzae]
MSGNWASLDASCQGDAILAPEDGEAESEFELRAQVLGASAHAQRLDRVLAALAPEFSRSHLQGLVEAGQVRLDGVVATLSSRKVRAGQRLEVHLVPPAESLAFRPEPMALDVVHEDMHVLVVNKPAGLVVHPAAGNWSGTLLNGLLARDPRAAQLPRAGIVHRLDKDTSGLMVVGRTLEAVTALVRDMAQRDIHRRYLALAHGDVGKAPFTVDAPVGRDPALRTRMAVSTGGKPARTDVQPVAFDGEVSAIRCKLHTGRTHQIRVHLSHEGHPLLADALYGGRPLRGMQRQALHAAELAFAHPITREPLSFEAPMPSDLAAAWQQVLATAQ